MNPMNRLIGKIKNYFQERSRLWDGVNLRDPVLNELLGIGSVGEVVVNADTALEFSAYCRAVTLVSSSIAKVPLRYLKLTNNSKTEFLDNSVRSLLVTSNPNPCTTPVIFYTKLFFDAIHHGNGFAEIKRDLSGSPISLWNLKHECVSLEDEDCNGYIWRYKDQEAKIDYIIPNHNIIHIPSLVLDGILGRPLYKLARIPLKSGMQKDVTEIAFYENGMGIGKYISRVDSLTEKAKEKIKAFLEQFKGPYKTNEFMVLDEGMKIESNPTTFENSQTVDSKKINILDIARYSNVPPHKLYDLDRATFSSVEVLTLDFLEDSLSPWLQRRTQEFTLKLCPPSILSDGISVKYMFVDDISKVIPVDTTTRYSNYNLGRNAGFLSLNDILKSEKMPTLPEDVGDTHLYPSTMKTVEKSDLSASVDVQKLQSMIDLIEKMGGTDQKTAKNLIDGVCPEATKEFVESCLNLLKGKNLIRNVSI